MLYILHGEHTTSSRKRLQELIEQHTQEANTPCIRLDAKRLTRAELEEALSSTQLFETAKCIVLEGLHSLPTSKQKKELITHIGQWDATAGGTTAGGGGATTNNTTTLIMWEKRALTKTMLKQFPEARAQSFELKGTLFEWLDTLGGETSPAQTKRSLQLLHQAIEQESEHFCFLMLARQVRLLIQAKDNGVISGPPFVKAKLTKQAARFTMQQLLDLHEHLLTIDIRSKTSRQMLSLAAELDLITLRV